MQLVPAADFVHEFVGFDLECSSDVIAVQLKGMDETGRAHRLSFSLRLSLSHKTQSTEKKSRIHFLESATKAKERKPLSRSSDGPSAHLPIVCE
mmetsp:Transcript_34090/g.67477  ORF Transcript_34090/g.67477 Transcript_34090/m.67477 type:complete len:94 (-) Transcript_34090:476-757(-)